MNFSPELRYSPPSYHSYGLPLTQSDPFEMNTVEVNFADINHKTNPVWHQVRGTDMRDMDPSDQGEGLFVTRDIKRGELVSFFSGRLLQEDIVSPLHRRRRSLSEMMQLKK